MENIYESPTWVIYWHSKVRCIHFVFQEYTKQLQEAEYKQELRNFIDLVNKYHPKCIFADTRDFHFTIAPAIQDFINENILSLYSAIGVEKHAILVSQDLFASVSVEQTMDEAEKPVFENKYFESEDKVSEWLSL